MAVHETKKKVLAHSYNSGFTAFGCTAGGWWF